MTCWLDPPPPPELSPIEGLHPLIAQALVRRDIITPEAARAFLDSDAYHPSPATDLPGLSAAADRVEKAFRRREPICVWGDFDVDGQTATTILFSALQTLGADVTYHIPVRAKESHGINIPLLTEIINNGAKLILTCDTGITAHEAVEYARSRGVDVVVTDHHDLPDALPKAAAVVNPKLLPAEHPLATLTGVGVAYKLAEALFEIRDSRLENRELGAGTNRDSRFSILDLLDLVALGLVADLALLKGDARYLVQKGLEALRNTRRLGLQTMMELAELNPAYLTEEHIGFVLGPRLNALGRLGDANPAVELLTTSDPARARVLATQLEGLNTQRQLLCSQVTQAAEAQLRADPSLLAQPVIVLSHPAWPGGIVGIVASRLVERYRKPAILFSTPANEPARGSARSVEGLNITAAIAAQKDLLLNFGGHPMAAGLSLEQEKLPEFRRRLAKTVEKKMGEVEAEPTLQIDGWLDLPEVTLELAENLEQLAPFGPGNEKLTLATRGLTLQSTATIGRNKEHLKLNIRDETGNAQTVLWWDGAGEPLPEGKFDLAYTIRASDWRGTRQVQMEFVDFRIVEKKPVEVKKPPIEILDYRNAKNPHKLLLSLPAGTLVWAEGEEKKRVGGVDRNGLINAEVLAIWTTPPGPEELHAALETVKPKTIYLFATASGTDEPKAFLERLTGLVKYAINKRAGRTSYAGLAAATAQRETTVRFGLEWLATSGHVVIEVGGDTLRLAIDSQAANQYAQQELITALKDLLEETVAYRAHFSRADCESILQTRSIE